MKMLINNGFKQASKLDLHKELLKNMVQKLKKLLRDLFILQLLINQICVLNKMASFAVWLIKMKIKVRSG